MYRIYATDEDIVPEILYIQKVRTDGEVDLAWQDIPYQCCKGSQAQPTPFWYQAYDVKEYKK